MEILLYPHQFIAHNETALFSIKKKRGLLLYSALLGSV
jgi:hypothetical protein